MQQQLSKRASCLKAIGFSAEFEHVLSLMGNTVLSLSKYLLLASVPVIAVMASERHFTDRIPVIFYRDGDATHTFLGRGMAVAVADFNGDGYPDIVWSYPPTGEVWLWMMSSVNHQAKFVAAFSTRAVTEERGPPQPCERASLLSIRPDCSAPCFDSAKPCLAKATNGMFRLLYCFELFGKSAECTSRDQRPARQAGVCTSGTGSQRPI